MSALSDIALSRVPARGTYDLTFSRGDVVFDEAGAHAVLTQILDERGSAGHPGWVWVDDGKHGSLLWTIGNDSPSTRSQAVAFVLDALQVLVDDGTITNPAAAFDPTTPTGRIDLVVSWSTAAGAQEPLRIPITVN